MTTTVSMGIPGVGEIRPGTHICALYSGPAERDSLLFPFLREGIRKGDTCLCLIDDAEPGSVRDGVEWQQDGGRARHFEQLNIDRASEVYLQSGRFSVQYMMSFLSGCLSMAAESEFPLLRIAGEMSWVLPQPEGAEDFFVYESAVNKIVEDKPAVFMCMYDLDRFGVSMLVDVLTTHPKVLLGGMVLDNPHYLTPREYLAAETASAATRYPPCQGSKAVDARDRNRPVAVAYRVRAPDRRARSQRNDEPEHRRVPDPVAPHGRRTPQAHLHQARHPLTRRTHGAGPAARLVGSGLIGAFDPCSAS
jgi:hypothetical protein